MINVTFRSEVERFDEGLNQNPILSLIFRSLTMREATKDAKKQGSHPTIVPTDINVALYTDLDNQLSYAIQSYVELDSGRMQVSDFVIKQVWKNEFGKDTLHLESEDGERIAGLDEQLTIALALLADGFRMAHRYNLGSGPTE